MSAVPAEAAGSDVDSRLAFFKNLLREEYELSDEAKNGLANLSTAAKTGKLFSKKPKSSIAIISAIVKQSCTSATSTSLTVRPAFWNAIFEAIVVALIPVRVSLPVKARLPDACPEPIISIGCSQYFFATSVDAIMTAAAPSVIGEQSRSFSGEATYPDSITS